MATNRRFLLVLWALFSFSTMASAVRAQESQGQQAEEAGRYGEALQHYQDALSSVSPGTRSDFKLREKIIMVAPLVEPPPVISPEMVAVLENGCLAADAAGEQAGYREAEKAFQRAADAAPWWANAYFNLAMTQDMLNKQRPAIYSYKLYLLADPDAEDAEFVTNRMNELKKAVITSKGAQPHFQHGKSLYHSKKNKEAVSELQKATEFDPLNGEARAMLGHSLSALQRYEESIPEFVDALRLGWKKMTVYVSLAYAYNQLGDPGKAVEYLEEGIREDPHGRNAELAHSNLKIYRKNLARVSDLERRTGPLGKQIHFTFTVAMMMPNPSDSLSIEVKNNNTGTRANSDVGFLFNIDADWRMSSFTSVGLSVVALEATFHEGDYDPGTLKTFAFGGQFKFLVPLTSHLEFRGGLFGGIAISTHSSPLHPGGTEVKMDGSMGLLGGFSFEIGYYLKPLGFIGEILGVTAEFGVVGQPFGWAGEAPNEYTFTLPPLFYLGLGFEAAI